MDWTQIPPPLITAGAGLVGVLVGSGITAWTTRRTHRERLEADQALAERKITADINLAKQKSESDAGLAERKFAFDKALVVWRRRYDLAEQVLIAAYEAKDAFSWARAPVTFVGEAATRVPMGDESERLRIKRNTFFIPMERLSNNSKVFATLQTLRYSASAHFGDDVLEPLGVITEIHHGIMLASRILTEHVQEDEGPSFRQNFDSVLESIGRTKRPDSTDLKIASAIERIEAICKPALSEMPPT